jgi:hypothetical protein
MMTEKCCDRDLDSDGNCDRHPSIRGDGSDIAKYDQKDIDALEAYRAIPF